MANEQKSVQFGTEVWPTELRLRESGTRLHVSFEDGAAYSLSAELLRVESPSAEVQGHGPDRKMIVPGKAKVRIVEIEPIGNYAVRLRFDDGHDTGIYSWSYLHRLGKDQDSIWQTYLKALSGAGMSRD